MPTLASRSSPSFASEVQWLESIGHATEGRLRIVTGGHADCRVPIEEVASDRFGARVALGPEHRFVALLDASLPLDRPSALAECATNIPCDAITFPRVRTRSNLLSALPSSGLPFALSDAGSSAFCDVSHPDALKAISRDNLRNVDRLHRRAEKDFGSLDIDRLTDGEALHSSVFDRFVALEDAGWKGSAGAGTSLAADPRAQAFFREVMRRFGADGRARIDFLTLAGRDAAAQLMVRTGPTWFLLKIGYHPDFKDVGPGGILLKALLEEMVADPSILEVNLTTNPRWAARWHFQSEPVYHVDIYNTTWRGRALYALRSGKEVAKSLRDAYLARRQPPAAR